VNSVQYLSRQFRKRSVSLILGEGEGELRGAQYVEVPVPTPGKGEVLVRVEASSVNQVDWRIQDGIAKHLLPCRFPFVPGTDIAAEVVTLGPGVTGFSPSDKVIAYLHVLVRCSHCRKFVHI
jgi:NADPH:quinone reductase-like Zn-dependent oxidoreductase